MNRRQFLKKMVSWGAFGAILTSYGILASFFLRFLSPRQSKIKRWLYVAQISRFPKGHSIPYVAPDGTKIEIARHGEKGEVKDFVALSKVCPHLGCLVRFEPEKKRFFCPCHNGIFNLSGKAIAGPPAKASQSLHSFPLKIKNDLLFIYLNVETLT